MFLVEFRVIFLFVLLFVIFFTLSLFLSLSIFSICIPRRVFYMSKEFRANNSCIQVESVPLQSVGGGRGCLSKGLVIFFDVSIVNAARRLTIKAAAKK